MAFDSDTDPDMLSTAYIFVNATALPESQAQVDTESDPGLY